MDRGLRNCIVIRPKGKDVTASEPVSSDTKVAQKKVIGPDEGVNLEKGFRKIQREALKELNVKMAGVKELDLEELSKILRICRENIRAIHERRLGDAEHRDKQIRFVTVMAGRGNASHT